MNAEATGSDFGPGDPAQEQGLARRRALEAARLQRIKDPKSRIMGIDTEALAQQVAEKQASAAASKKRPTSEAALQKMASQVETSAMTLDEKKAAVARLSQRLLQAPQPAVESTNLQELPT